MIRSDGNITCYVLECRSNAPGYENRWFLAGLDHFGTPPGFSASGPCWQKTGIHGTFDEEEGFSALRVMSSQHIEYDWRLMKLEISQKHSEVATIQAKTPGAAPPSTHSYPTAEDEELRRRIRIIHNGGKKTTAVS